MIRGQAEKRLTIGSDVFLPVAARLPARCGEGEEGEEGPLLSTQLWTAVLGWLPLSDLCRVRLVCRQLGRAGAAPALWAR